MILFEWDEAKGKTNRLKHGISFEVAILVFADPYARYFGPTCQPKGANTL